MVQWLRLHASIAGGIGSIPGWGTKILHAAQWPKKKKKKKKAQVQTLPGDVLARTPEGLGTLHFRIQSSGLSDTHSSLGRTSLHVLQGSLRRWHLWFAHTQPHSSSPRPRPLCHTALQSGSSFTGCRCPDQQSGQTSGRARSALRWESPNSTPRRPLCSRHPLDPVSTCPWELGANNEHTTMWGVQP